MDSNKSRTLVLETANQVALDILARRTGVEALRHIADAARMLAGAQYAALGVARADGAGLVEFVTVGLSHEAELRIGSRPIGKGVLGMLLQRTEPLRIDKLGGCPGAAGFPPNHPPMDSFLGVPIRRGETNLGSLYLTNKVGADAFTDADTVAVQALGYYAAVAIHYMQMERQQQRLLSGLMTAQEEERRSVAYDLHDGLTQYVMAAHAHLEAFRRATNTGNTEKAARDLDLSIKYMKEAVTESRRLVNGLRTLALDDLGLAGAVEQLLVDEKKRAGWHETDFIHNIAGKRFARSLETAVYRVAQEALTNARKHAHADEVRVLLLFTPCRSPLQDTPAELMLEVTDYGCGFEPGNYEGVGTGPDVPHKGAMYGVGLHSMLERVRLMDGRYELITSPGAGTIIRAIFPAMDPLPEENL